MKFNQKLEKLLQTLDKFLDIEGNLLKQNVKHSAEQFDHELIKLLLSDRDTTAHFFDTIDKATVFNYRQFIDYIDDKNFLIDSYTKFSNKVGLTISNKHIQQINEVVLSFPFKDCILEGGQSKDDEKRKEIFFNEVLARDEINRLLDKKVITNAKKYTQNGAGDKVSFKRNENGLIKDNLIIKGNNLLALHTLKNNFAGKVKLIYIDPPYNTGNDGFNYNDNFNHSTWLTFMKNRLEVARDLLSDDGVIFVQCDDNEQAYLKVLMDEIFERSNFVNCIAVKMSEATGVKMNHSKIRFPKIKEYLLFYKKAKQWDGFVEVVKYKAKKWDAENNIFLENFSKQQRGKLLKIQKKDTISDKDIEDTNLILRNIKKVSLSTAIKNIKPKNQEEWLFENAYRIIKTTGSESITKQILKLKTIPGQDIASFKSPRGILFYYITNFNRNTQAQRIRVIFADENIYKNPCDFWQDIKTSGAIANEGSVQLHNGKKPESLLRRIIKMATKKGDLVLDYHLGSGTTCAVAHKMGRQYIGIEQMDYIEDIAVKRMQKVIGKKTKKNGELLESVNFDNGGISKSVDWQGGGEFIYFELDKYNQKYIDDISIATDKTINKLYDEITEKAFLNYDVESEKLTQEKNAFKILSLSEQQEFLISILNKNQLYKNLSEIDDKDLTVSDKTKTLNKGFYNE